jgi:hypothetical protein
LCHYSIAEPYQRLPLDCITLTPRLRHGLRMYWSLGDMHGLTRKALRAKRGIGPKSVAYFEELLGQMLLDGFMLVRHEEWIQPGLPGIAGRPIMELLPDGHRH